MSYALQYRREDYGEETPIFYELSAKTLDEAVDEAVERLLNDMTEDDSYNSFEDDISRHRRARIISFTVEREDLEDLDVLEIRYEKRYQDCIKREKEYEERRQRQHYESLKKRFEGTE